MDSIWKTSSGCNNPQTKTLNGNIQTDVLVIGAGLAGILCAYKLKQSGVSCIVSETRRRQTPAQQTIPPRK